MKFKNEVIEILLNVMIKAHHTCRIGMWKLIKKAQRAKVTLHYILIRMIYSNRSLTPKRGKITHDMPMAHLVPLSALLLQWEKRYVLYDLLQLRGVFQHTSQSRLRIWEPFSWLGSGKEDVFSFMEQYHYQLHQTWPYSSFKSFIDILMRIENHKEQHLLTFTAVQFHAKFLFV